MTRLLLHSRAPLQYISLLFISLLLLIGVARGQQTCVDGDETCSSNNSANDDENNPRRTVFIENLSNYRADVHYDDGRFGKLVSTVDPNGGRTGPLNSFVDHQFFITMHGVREGLVNPTTDEQYFFTVSSELANEFVIPKDATTSKKPCKDRYPVCKHEAQRGECTNNPGWMIVNCCQSCEEKEGYGHLIDSEVRCTRERLNATIPAFDVGSLDKLFTRWATEEEFQKFDPHVVSSPGKIHGGEHDGPWILTFDSFINDEEIEDLLKGAEYGGFERSTSCHCEQVNYCICTPANSTIFTGNFVNETKQSINSCMTATPPFPVSSVGSPPVHKVTMTCFFSNINLGAIFAIRFSILPI